ncbi:hypothetical protein [Streptacidiphilus fuscans]|uniref:Uncharacterized protein n=1 Tax=Streptacidiphilus fuscans TaxID=2789292 RepID=A0A931B3C8_9ACTN|nr:hypothetical protein [Streptacidiphilus fuscans]MBF9070465.1 hypothetical protein [Streptacidiphilus fuscans]
MDPTELPEIAAWVDIVGDFDPKTFCAAHVPVAHAFALVEIFRPDFVEYQGMVLLKSAFNEEAVDAWIERLEGDRASIEGVVNEVHLWDLFRLESDAEYRAVSAIAPKIANMWISAAREAFPAKRFRVALDSSPDSYGPTLTIFTLD